jgi:hypothetical protein
MTFFSRPVIATGGCNFGNYMGIVKDPDLWKGFRQEILRIPENGEEV